MYEWSMLCETEVIEVKMFFISFHFLFLETYSYKKVHIKLNFRQYNIKYTHLLEIIMHLRFILIVNPPNILTITVAFFFKSTFEYWLMVNSIIVGHKCSCFQVATCYVENTDGLKSGVQLLCQVINFRYFNPNANNVFSLYWKNPVCKKPWTLKAKWIVMCVFNNNMTS